MRTTTVKLYSYDELSDEARERVLETKRQEICDDPYNHTLEECMTSLKKIAEDIGVKLTDWSIGPYNRGNRCSCEPMDSRRHEIVAFYTSLKDHNYPVGARLKDTAFPGSCGYTGWCFDDAIVEAIHEALMDGERLSIGFDRAADVIMRICESEHEYQTSDEGILEYLDAKEEIYTEDGNEF